MSGFNPIAQDPTQLTEFVPEAFFCYVEHIICPSPDISSTTFSITSLVDLRSHLFCVCGVETPISEEFLHHKIFARGIRHGRILIGVTTERMVLSNLTSGLGVVIDVDGGL